MNTPPIYSVSVLFIYKEKILTVQRQSYLRDFPGYLAFPGGKIDKDESSVPLKTKFLSEHEAILMRALKREVYEELGYDLEEGINNGEISSVSELAEILAPEFAQIRYRTWFYRVDLSKKINFILDSGEFAISFWESPEVLLESFHAGKILMVPPTRWVLEKLQNNPCAKQLGNLSANYKNNDKVPCLEMLDGIEMLAVRSATIPPADRTNAFLLGDEGATKLLVDPSPNSEKELQRLLNTIEYREINSIFLTHHHPDHHQFSNQLARKLSIPIILSIDTQKRLVNKFGAAYFEKIQLHNSFDVK